MADPVGSPETNGLGPMTVTRRGYALLILIALSLVGFAGWIEGL